ncbi:MAG: putative lipid II flippase FtsW [Gammaproteobacteria bacterium]|nr:putative lipid II flippase FtsW [Gammaproteobacteria bacterium]
MTAVRLDTALVWLWIALLAAGLVAVTSASMELAANRYGDAFHHLLRHGAYLVLASMAFLAVLSVPTSIWAGLDRFALVLAVALLALLFVPGLGREVNGSLRWIAFGPVSLQPSEPVRFLLVVYLAGYVVRHQQAISSNLLGLLRPLLWLLIPCALLVAQPDLGSAVVIMAAAVGLLFLCGARMLHLSLLGAAAVAGLWLLLSVRDYRMARLQAFLDPWAPDVQFGSGYQLTQALIAFGRGEWLGVGLGEGLQKLFYLPEAHTDFIFAVIAEETGVVGALLLCAALMALVLRGLWHGRMAQRRGADMAAGLAYGAALMLGIQALVSLGVNTGLLPTKGLTLPLVSYGGNSLIVCSALVALLVRVAWENAESARPVHSGRRREVAA